MPNERLSQARRAAGYETASAAAEAMGAPVASYVQHENGGRGLSRSAERYAAFFHTTPEWLLYGRGDPPKAVPGRPILTPVSRMVPILGEVRAGAWTEIQEEAEPTEAVPVHLPGFDQAQLFALRVVGRSMDLIYPDGSLVIVCPAAENGVRLHDHVVVRRHKGGLVETTLKEVTRDKGGIVLQPRSTDPKQLAIRIETVRDADEGPEIVAVVVASYSIRPMQRQPLLQF